jgi:hypothetical protein
MMHGHLTSRSEPVNVLSLGERTAGALLRVPLGEGFSANDNGSLFAKPLTHPLPEGEERFVALPSTFNCRPRACPEDPDLLKGDCAASALIAHARISLVCLC